MQFLEKNYFYKHKNQFEKHSYPLRAFMLHLNLCPGKNARVSLSEHSRVSKTSSDGLLWI